MVSIVVREVTLTHPRNPAYPGAPNLDKQPASTIEWADGGCRGRSPRVGFAQVKRLPSTRADGIKRCYARLAVELQLVPVSPVDPVDPPGSSSWG